MLLSLSNQIYNEEITFPCVHLHLCSHYLSLGGVSKLGSHCYDCFNKSVLLKAALTQQNCDFIYFIKGIRLKIDSTVNTVKLAQGCDDLPVSSVVNVFSCHICAIRHSSFWKRLQFHHQHNYTDCMFLNP